ncbi:Rv2231c family pyridoxal phosphate-dependent protein CobC [Streptomyces uncialis]|uniref:Rv2231c family pyridoxal phosphate-dependent protein CobC n=1 Tax=Streptomyces uncialis TaxID=1048205 RepID=UPI0009A10BB1|nr:Rv2231c family pyridoxal phosphate-dependent protein CobC [Streptomyces uncialis]
MTSSVPAPSPSPGPVVAGVGASRGVSEDEVLELVHAVLREAGADGSALSALATVAAKAGEPGVVGAAARLGVPLLTYPADRLAGVPVPEPSDRTRAAVGTPSVAEAAALIGGGRLLVPKRRSAGRDGGPSRATCALALGAGLPQAAGLSAEAPEYDLRHHGDAEVRDDGRELTDLAVNVRERTPPDWLRERIAASLTGLAAYPDGRAARAAVAARHAVTAEEVLLTAGAAEAFVLIARALSPERAVVVHPQFTEPEAALRDAGHRVERVLLRPEDGFRLTPGAVPDDADLVVIGNPTNPTSVLHPAAVVAGLARPGRTLVVDEAFMDAVPGERESLAGHRVPGLIVLRSLTKTWGLAGLRVGYVVADPGTVRLLERAQPLWPVSSPGLVAMEACVSPEAVAEAGRVAVRVGEDRERLLSGLAGFGAAVTVAGVPEGPFVLVRVPDGIGVRERLRGLGFAVRRGDTFPGLGAGWLRVAVRDAGTVGRFLEALGSALPSPSPAPMPMSSPSPSPSPLDAAPLR